MDPITVGLTVFSVSRIVIQVSTVLYDFVQSSKKVDQTLNGLFAEVENLRKAISAIDTTIQSPSIQEYCKETHELWTSVDESLSECQKTCAELDQDLCKVRGQSEDRGALRQAIKQIKLNWEGININFRRSQIQVHTTTMQLALQTINVYISSKGPEVVIAKLNPKLDVLLDMMTMFNPEIPNQHAIGVSIEATRAGAISRSSQRLKQAAEEVVSRASIIFDTDEAAEGRRLNSPRSPANRMSAVSQHREPLSPLIAIKSKNLSTFFEEEDDTTGVTISSETRLGGDSSHIGSKIADTINLDESLSIDSDSEGDISLEVFDELVRAAQQHYEDGYFGDAAGFFSTALKEAESLSVTRVSIGHRNALKLRLGIALVRFGKWNEAKPVLLNLTQAYQSNPADPEWDILEILHASHILAEAYLHLAELEQAVHSCKRAMLGRRKLLGKFHPSCVASQKLLVSVLEAKGDIELAAAYAALLPPEANPVDLHLASEHKAKQPDKFPRESPLGSQGDEAFQSKESGLVSVIAKRPKPPPPPLPPRNARTENRVELPNSSGSASSPPTKGVPQFSDNKTKDFDLPSIGQQHSLLTQQERLEPEVPIFEPTKMAKTVAYLSKRGFDIFSPRLDLETALFVAVSDGETAAVQVLLKGTTRWGSDGKISQQLSRPGEELKAGETRSRTVKKINAKESLSKSRPSWTALHRAVAKGNEGMVRLLIKNGANLEMKTGDNRTPLMLAAEREYVPVLQVLLWKGANINAKAGRLDDHTALSRAILAGKEYSVRLLLQYGPDLEMVVSGKQSLTPMGLAAKQGNLAMVRELAEKGAKVDAKKTLSSPLIVAAENGHHHVIRALLELGAPVDAVHTYNNTALKAAAHNGHLEAVRVLLDQGATVEEHPKGKGKSALAKAIKYKYWDVAQLLTNRGAKPGVDYETFQRMQLQSKVPQLDSAGNVIWT